MDSVMQPGKMIPVAGDVRDVSAADTILDLENMIKTGIEQGQRTAAEIKRLNEMLQSALLNDEAYRTADEQVKEETKARLKARAVVLENKATREVYEKLRDLRQEARETRIAQSEYLREYKRMSGSTQLELFDGSVGEIVEVCKLIKTKGRKS